jgi:biofilm protein TabA
MYEPDQEGVYVFLSSSADDVGCESDLWFEDIESADEYCAKYYGACQKDWIEIDNPTPDCQHDFIRPVRVKGRDTGNPQFGNWEIFDGLRWIDFLPGDYYG